MLKAHELIKVYLKSSSILSLVITTITCLITILAFITYSYSNSLEKVISVLHDGEIESKKMQINSELVRMARSRTRITAEIIATDDYFRKDELNMELDAYAGKFSALRQKLLSMPLTPDENKIIKHNDNTVSEILPKQRLAVEMALSDLEKDNQAAVNILYNEVMPGQQKLIDAISNLLSIEQLKIVELSKQSKNTAKLVHERNLQLVTVIIIIASILSIVVVMRIRKIQLELARSYADLEIKIAERTKELSELNMTLKNSSEHDELTGIYNRRKFNSFLYEEYSQIMRSGGYFSLAMIDIDYFKSYNDNYGHQKGDECLSTVASIILKSLTRSSDFVARYGGEEFVLILPSTKLEGAIKMCECIRQNIHDEKIQHNHSKISAFLTLSIGVTTYHASDSLNKKEIINIADELLYQAKANGRNRVESKLST